MAYVKSHGKAQGTLSPVVRLLKPCDGAPGGLVGPQPRFRPFKDCLVGLWIKTGGRRIIPGLYIIPGTGLLQIGGPVEAWWT